MQTRDQNERLFILLLRALIFLGGIALLYYFSWWVEDYRYTSLWRLIILIPAVLYAGVQMLGNWVLYLAARRPDPAPAWTAGLTVDVFVTACGEPYPLIQRALVAACAIRGEHKTWLLDDRSDPALARMARHLGAGYLTRKDRKHAKAGNLNCALAHTSGDIIAIFDLDHIPTPDYLEKTIGSFADPKTGFVQVMLTFGNGDDTWIAGAAMESSLEFYNPTYLGTAGVGGVTMMGSNSLIRRTALESIGGYQPGLAEDLATSIALHAAGWSSVYLAEPLAPGIAPPDLDAWFTQQLKWARGVFELLLTAFPRLFFRLTWGQRLSYAVRMTRYWIGPAIGVHLLATIAILIYAGPGVRGEFHDYLAHIAPLLGLHVLISTAALQIWRHPSTPRLSPGRAVTLVYSTWPVYLWAWVMAIFRLPLSFRPTPKTRSEGPSFLWLIPQAVAFFSLAGGLLYTVLVVQHPPSLLLLFASAQAALQLYFFAKWILASGPGKGRSAMVFRKRGKIGVDD